MGRRGRQLLKRKRAIRRAGRLARVLLVYLSVGLWGLVWAKAGAIAAITLVLPVSGLVAFFSTLSPSSRDGLPAIAEVPPGRRSPRTPLRGARCTA